MINNSVIGTATDTGDVASNQTDDTVVDRDIAIHLIEQAIVVGHSTADAPTAQHHRVRKRSCADLVSDAVVVDVETVGAGDAVRIAQSHISSCIHHASNGVGDTVIMDAITQCSITGNLAITQINIHSRSDRAANGVTDDVIVIGLAVDAGNAQINVAIGCHITTDIVVSRVGSSALTTNAVPANVHITMRCNTTANGVIGIVARSTLASDGVVAHVHATYCGLDISANGIIGIIDGSILAADGVANYVDIRISLNGSTNRIVSIIAQGTLAGNRVSSNIHAAVGSSDVKGN